MFELLIVGFLIFLNAVFALSELAVVSSGGPS
ncbi:CBS domain containing-hemolysin-like protein [Phyllobacterium trifolii]|uniref:CBS domain containing-hemolysin-like protein n=1 Tax=Phyllobacterium trifolii TaxID=300193 RepID=A0A839UCM4_9HYPH|nr:CBS domain containing-hemolysin-like protein [Phyllobacterium trifolii]